MSCPNPTVGDIFDLRGVNREARCIVVVRPDQYIAHALPLDAHDALTGFLATDLDRHQSTTGTASRRPGTRRDNMTVRLPNREAHAVPAYRVHDNRYQED
jgi:hypothetical protein